jgi:hypothetical protein
MTPTYRVWAGMRKRCTNPHDESYKNYGGRGIAICERWQSFENFLADMGEKPRGLTIERIDNDRGYEPDNCRWASRAEQNKNQRRNRRQLSVDAERDLVARVERGETYIEIATAMRINRNTVGEVWKRMRPGRPNPNRGRARIHRSGGAQLSSL